MGMRNRLKPRKFYLVFGRSAIKTLYSQKKDLPLATEDYRARFYETYRREAEDYDKEFIKKYDEDLNTTLIFVSPAHCSDQHVSTWMTGRSVFCRDFRLHHRGQLPTPA